MCKLEIVCVCVYEFPCMCVCDCVSAFCFSNKKGAYANRTKSVPNRGLSKHWQTKLNSDAHLCDGNNLFILSLSDEAARLVHED